MIRKTVGVGLLLIPLLVLLGDRSLAQRMPPIISSSPQSSSSDQDMPPKGPSRKLKMMKESFEQTQKDTAELYDLATQLKEEVEKADENTLSLDVIKKAEAVEKLAEKIKNRMKNL